MTLTPRRGPRPTTSDEGPHRQVDQLAPAELWGELVLAATTIEGVREGHSSVSPASSRALFLDGHERTSNPTTSLATPDQRLEPVHLHGVTDTSLHLCLPRERAQEVCAAGWGEAHQYADHATEIMVYGPRDADEMAVVLGLVRESLDVARVHNP
ncbi:luciferase domain-containing protein [Oerskovia merdavium]|uniref:luciferase domain-containing protein n=1 Tax=Oerskovia merdavium TaxID=2762227 RepID=UPI001CD8FC28|nr:luciferase family protein [Oerskovia merdavium]